MASLFIAEFRHYNKEGTLANWDSLITVQKVSISGTSAQSAALNAQTKCIGIWADSNFRAKKGTNPTAADSSDNLPNVANQWHYYLVDTADKIAAITV